MACVPILRTVGRSTFIGCTCTPGQWLSIARGARPALDRLHANTRPVAR